jgi:signal transduction histidine kinase
MAAMRPRSARWAIGLIGLALGAVAEAVLIGHGAVPERALIDFAVGETYLLGGLSAWGRQPTNRTWPLMTAVGLAWFVGSFATSGVPVVRELGAVFADTDAIFLIALVLAYPDGRLDSGLDRAIVAVAAVGLIGAGALFVATGISAPAFVIGLGVTVAVGLAVAIRWRRAPRGRRRVLGPPLLAVAVTLVAVGVAIAVRLAGVPEEIASAVLSARDIGVLAIPIGFVVGSFQLVEDELLASRARIVSAADAERRRLERDLHDGAQQRFVALSIALRVLRTRLGPDPSPDVAAGLDAADQELRAGIAELRELARGIHPAILADEGLAGALPALADRSAIPTAVLGVPDHRLPGPVEATAYFVASEALTNAARHSGASRATLEAGVVRGTLRLEVADDGVGGARVSDGTGLPGLVDRVAALGGDLEVVSPPGGGTRISAAIPLAIGDELRGPG